MTTLIGDTNGSYTTTPVTLADGYIDGYEFVAAFTGTIDSLFFRTNATTPTCDTVVLAVYDSLGALLGFGAVGSIAASSWLEAGSVAADVVQGATYRLAVQPFNGSLFYDASDTGGVGQRSTGSFATRQDTFPASSAHNVGPVGFYGVGTVAIITHGLVFQMTGLWKPGETTVPFYGQISDPLAGEVVIPLNDSRTASVTVSSTNPLVETLAALTQQPYAIFLKVFYEGNLVFWGPVKVRAGDFVAGTVRFDAVDMTLRLIHHMIREGDTLLGGGGIDTASGRGYIPVSHAGLMALVAAAQTATFPTLGIADGTDSFTVNPNAILGITRGDPIYTIWQQVASSEGPDWELAPDDTTSQVYAVLNTVNKQGSDKSASIQFHYGTGRSNLEGLSFAEGETYINMAHVLDKDSRMRKTRTNATALARTGPYISWEATEFDITHSLDADAEAVLQAYGTEVIDAYSVPLVALTMTLPLDTEDGFHYVTDYIVGDTIGAAGRDGFLDLPLAPYRITKVSLRLEGDGVRPSLDVIADRVATDSIDGTDA